MALILWTTADAQALQQVVGPVIRTAGVPHKVDPLIQRIPDVKEGDVILAMGSRPLATLQKAGMLPKNRTVTSLREKPIRVAGATILCTFDPTIVEMDYARLPEIQWDVQLAARILKTGSPRPEIGEYRYVESYHEIIEYVEAQYKKTGKAVPVACDLETKSLNPYNPEAWIISISFTAKGGTADVMYFEKHEAPVRPKDGTPDEDLTYWEGVWRQIHWLLTTPQISLRGANFKYDCHWLYEKWGIYVENLKFDTVLVGSLLDENRSNSLKLHAKIMTNMGGYEDDMDKYDFGALEKVPKEELLNYAGGDTDVTQQVADKMRSELIADKRLANFYIKLLQPASRAFESMERTGVVVDVDYMHQLESELKAEISGLHHKMLEFLPNKMKMKYRDDIAASLSAGKSPFKPKILTEFLFTPAGLNLKPKVLTTKTNAPSTAMEHLMMFDDDPVAANFISSFKDLGSASKTLSTFVVGFMKHLREDGRFHPTYMLHRGDYGSSDSGTTTGRTSAKDPAVQTIPKHSQWAKRLRRAYVAPEGKTIIQADFSQGELRIAAVVAEEPTMIQAYQTGADLHSLTAARLNGYDMEEFSQLPKDTIARLRSGGKAGNFGLIYGMSANGFREYAFATYGVVMTAAEAQIAREQFFDLYSGLVTWHERTKEAAHRWGQVRSPLGRVRRLPLINSRDNSVRAQSERQAINSPIQATLSDMMQLSMASIDEQYGSQVDMFMMTHDSIALYVPEGEEVEWGKRIKAIMENLPLKEDFGWDSPLKFYADVEAGATLADLEDLNL